MKSIRRKKRGISSPQDESWSLPWIWILLVILVVLHLVFGWVVWLIAVGLFIAISLAVAIYDAMISRNRE